MPSTKTVEGLPKTIPTIAKMINGISLMITVVVWKVAANFVANMFKVKIKNKETKEPFASEDRVGYQIYKIALEKGLLLRPLGNILYFMPPYVITKEEIKTMIDLANEAIQQYFEKQGGVSPVSLKHSKLGGATS